MNNIRQAKDQLNFLKEEIGATLEKMDRILKDVSTSDLDRGIISSEKSILQLHHQQIEQVISMAGENQTKLWYMEKYKIFDKCRAAEIALQTCKDFLATWSNANK